MRKQNVIYQNKAVKKYQIRIYTRTCPERMMNPYELKIGLARPVNQYAPRVCSEKCFQKYLTHSLAGI